MNQYFVEGLYATRQGIKKARKGGLIPLAYIEPNAKTIWANSPDEAIQIATQELDGGEWTESPRLSKVSEEQRMRAMGAPEFPGLEKPKPKKRKI
jgi:hypothetical protein